MGNFLNKIVKLLKFTGNFFVSPVIYDFLSVISRERCDYLMLKFSLQGFVKSFAMSLLYRLIML